MHKLVESSDCWRYVILDGSRVDRVRVKKLEASVSVATGRVKGTSRWEIQGYIFAKGSFKSEAQVRAWLDKHFKAEIQTLLDFKAWDEWRRRFVNAYMQISSVS